MDGDEKDSSAQTSSMVWEEYRKMQKQVQEQTDASKRLFNDTVKDWNALTHTLKQCQSEGPSSENAEKEGAEQASSEPKAAKTEETVDTKNLSPLAKSFSGLVQSVSESKVFEQANPGKKPQGLEAFYGLLGALNKKD